MNAYWILKIQFITRRGTQAPHLYILMGIPEVHLVHYIELDLRFLDYGESIVVYRIRIILFTFQIYLVSVV